MQYGFNFSLKSPEVCLLCLMQPVVDAALRITPGLLPRHCFSEKYVFFHIVSKIQKVCYGRGCSRVYCFSLFNVSVNHINRGWLIKFK